MKTTKYLIVLALALWAPVATSFGHEFKRAVNFLDVWKGSCLISVPSAMGSGMFNGIDADEGKAVITTNYHVVTENKRATLIFLTNGRFQTVEGVVRRKAYDESMPVDAAQIYVDPDALAKIDPPYTPYAGRDMAPSVGDVIASSGCPRGTFPKAWQGTVLKYYNRKTAVFTPAPEPGQSGSAIVSFIDGLPWQTGILTWLFTEDKTGGAIPIKNVYEAFEGRRASEDPSPAIPSDATLVAQSVPVIMEFTQDNCPPCVAAEKTVARLREAEANVQKFNMSTEEGKRAAKGRSIKGTPTFVIVDELGIETARFEGAGHYEEILGAYNEVKTAFEERVQKELEAQAEAIVATEPAKPEIEPEIDLTCPVAQESESKASYRWFPPIYEPISESRDDVSFMDDQDAAWRNRERWGGNNGNSEDKPSQGNNGIGGIGGGALPSPNLDEHRLGDRIVDRLASAIGGAIKKELDGAVKEFEREVDKRVEEKIAKYKAQIARRIVVWTVWIGLAIFGIVALANVATLYFVARVRDLFEEETEESSEEMDVATEDPSEPTTGKRVAPKKKGGKRR